MRYLVPEIERLWREEGKMAFVAGPRQVGKTTLAKALLPSSSAYFNWDTDSHRKALLKDPEGFWRSTASSISHPRVVLDEIHKYPRWKRFLKGIYDANVGQVNFLVTGSGRLDIYQRGGDSLLGRYGLYRLHPFTVGEWMTRGKQALPSPEEFWKRVLSEDTPAGAEEAFKRVDRYSGFPEPLFAGKKDRLNRWRLARERLVIREDLRDLTRIREIGLIESLILMLPERIGSPLSINNLAQTLGVAFNTVAGWLESLQRLYFIFEIRPFSGRMARALRREGKVYLFDPTGIENLGARFENLVGLHLKKLADVWTDLGYGMFNLAYVRDRERHETDFLLLRDGRPYVLIETKLSDPIPDRSLLYFKERLKPAHAFQIVRNLSGPPVQKRSQGMNVVSAAHLLSNI